MLSSPINKDTFIGGLLFAAMTQLGCFSATLAARLNPYKSVTFSNALTADCWLHWQRRTMKTSALTKQCYRNHTNKADTFFSLLKTPKQIHCHLMPRSVAEFELRVFSDTQKCSIHLLVQIPIEKMFIRYNISRKITEDSTRRRR